MNTWDVQAFGCIERDTFQLDPANRTEMSSIGAGRFYSTSADRRAPLTARWQAWQTFPQQKAFWQWYHNDLHGGALPFQVWVWLWDRSRLIRAHIIGAVTTRYEEQYNMRLTAGQFEIERESIFPTAQWTDPPAKPPTCLPDRSTWMTKLGVHKTTCVPTRLNFLVPPELQKAATCVPARSDVILPPPRSDK